MERNDPDDLPTSEVFEGVHLRELTDGDQANVNHLELEPGGEVPIHSHSNEQHGFVHRGTLTLTFEDREDVEVQAGEGYALAGNEPHGAANFGDEPVIAVDVFSPPRYIETDD